MTQHAAALTFKELLIELIQGAQKMLASPSGQDFPSQGLLVIFPGSTAHGFHYAGGRQQGKKRTDNNIVNLYWRETNAPTSGLTL